MNISLSKNANIILNEDSTFGEIKTAIDEISAEFYIITNLPAKIEKADHGSILPHGEALSPQTAAGCIFDYTRTTKFLRGIKNAIDHELEQNKGEKIKVLYAGSGPFATLIMPLIPLYSESQLSISIIDFHTSAIDSLNTIISTFGFTNFFDEIIVIDGTKYKNRDANLFDIIIIETMMKALYAEPQVALTNHLSQFLAKDGILIPKKIEVSAVLADLRNELSFSQSKWRDFWLNFKRNYAKEKRILLKDIFILDKNIKEKYFSQNIVNNQITLPKVKVQNKIGRMRNLILLTEINIFDDIILSEEDDTGLTKLYYDQNLKPVEEGAEINFSYQLGSYPRFLMEIS